MATATDAQTGETSLVAIPQTSRTQVQTPTPQNQSIAVASAPVPTEPLAIAETNTAQTNGQVSTAQGVIENAVAPSASSAQSLTPPSSAVLQGANQTNPTVNPSPEANTLALVSPSALPESSDATASAVQPSTQPQNQAKPSSNLFARLFQTNNATDRTKTTRTRTQRNGRDDDNIRIAAAHDRGKPRVNASRRAETQAAVIANRTRANANRNSSALPGVKSNDEIFGIKRSDENDTNTANQRVTPETRLASMGSLGLLSPNGLRVQHEKVQVACLKPGVIRLLRVVERHYGKKPIITSGYRSPNRNRRAGGAKNSQHIYCKAVDIQVEGVSKWDLAKFLRTIPGRGGVGTYCRTRSVHLDIGSKRDWHHPCRRSSKRKKKKA